MQEPATVVSPRLQLPKSERLRRRRSDCPSPGMQKRGSRGPFAGIRVDLSAARLVEAVVSPARPKVKALMLKPDSKSHSWPRFCSDTKRRPGASRSFASGLDRSWVRQRARQDGCRQPHPRVAVAIRDLPGPGPRSEWAAVADGFRLVELVSTVSGRPLYVAAGFEATEEVTNAAGSVRSRSWE
jgi:hypothetical protein